MKIIFLDHDGVICLFDEWESRFTKKGYRIPGGPIEDQFDNFNKKAVIVLNEIIRETNAEIVVSSDWRYHCTMEEMGRVYDANGIIKKPIGYTKIGDFSPDGFTYDPKWDLEQSRSWEIRKWLSEHPEADKWVSIDDLDMRIRKDSFEFEWGLSNFVHTPRSREGIKQSGVGEKILSFLL